MVEDMMRYLAITSQRWQLGSSCPSMPAVPTAARLSCAEAKIQAKHVAPLTTRVRWWMFHHSNRHKAVLAPGPVASVMLLLLGAYVQVLPVSPDNPTAQGTSNSIVNPAFTTL